MWGSTFSYLLSFAGVLLLPLFWIWVAAVGYSFGHALVGRQPARVAPELVVAGGLAALSWLLAVLSFGTGIGREVQVGVSATALTYAGWRWLRAASSARKQWAQELLAPLRGPGRGWVFALLLVYGGLVLVHAVQPPSFPDSGLYHAQAIQWAQRFPVAPGLGNLHGRLAFNSHLHLLTAFFSASPGPQHPAWQQAAGSFWFLLLVSYAGRQLARTRTGGELPSTLALYYVGALALVFVAYRPWISSPMPDSGVALLTLLLLGWALEKLLLRGPAAHFTRAEVLLLAVLLATAITYKVSASYLVLPLGFVAWRLRPPAKGWYGAAGLALLGVLLPWLARNVVLSGYLVYPLAWWAALPVDWKVPSSQLLADLREIRDFARWPAEGWQAVASMRPEAWLPFWWRQQYPGDQRLLLSLVALIPALGVARWLRRTSASTRPIEGLFGLLLLCCAAWFVTAPAFRFGYGYLIGAALVGAWLLVQGLPGQLVRLPLLVLALAYGANGLRNEVMRTDAVTWLLPAGYPPLPTATVLVHGRPMHVADDATGGRCGNSPVPCTSGPPARGLEWRGAQVQQGFRISKAHQEVHR